MNIAVLSRSRKLYSTRRLVEASQQRGHNVQVYNHIRCYMSIEQDNPAIYYKKEPIEEVDAIIPRIGASVTFYGTAVVRQFEMQNVFTVNRSQAIVRSRDKLRSYQILAREGVGIPKTVFASQAEDTDSLLDSVGGPPIIVKLLSGTQGKGVVIAETRTAAKSVIEAFNGLGEEILVQEFIKEAKGGDIRAFVINGKVVGAIKRQGKEGEFRSNLHLGGTIQPIKLTKEERKVASRAAKVLGLSVAGVDMLQAERAPLVLEVNSSPGLEGIENGTGKNIAGKIVQYIERASTQKTHHEDRVGV